MAEVTNSTVPEEVKREIKVGDPFFLDGLDYTVKVHPQKPEKYIRFENDKKRGICLKKELIWHTKLKTWTMMGRLLSQEDKMRFQLKAVDMPWGLSQPGWGPRADDQELVRVMIEKKEI